jgi:hypothetical protein
VVQRKGILADARKLMRKIKANRRILGILRNRLIEKKEWGMRLSLALHAVEVANVECDRANCAVAVEELG